MLLQHVQAQVDAEDGIDWDAACAHARPARGKPAASKRPSGAQHTHHG
ncbi:hypothetical protein [Streptomyces sp. NPDC055400]